MERSQRPQRQRRVASRFREGDAIPSASRVKSGPTLPPKVSTSLGRGPAQSKKRRISSSAEKAPHLQDAASPEVLMTSHTSPAVSADPAKGLVKPNPASSPHKDPTLGQVAGMKGAVTSPDAGPSNGEAQQTSRPATSGLTGKAAQSESSSDSSDIQIIEPSVKSVKSKAVDRIHPCATHPKQAEQAPQRKCRPSTSYEQSSPPAGPSSPSIDTPPSAAAIHPPSPAPTNATALAPASPSRPSLQGPYSPGNAQVGQEQAATGCKPEAAHADSCPPQAAQPALEAVGSPSGNKETPVPAPPSHFLPLFQREATPPRPDFSVGNDDGSDTDSDGFDILAQHGRKGKKAKAAVRPSRRGSLLASSPVGSSPGSSPKGTPARRGRPGSDTSWLHLPSPDQAADGPARAGPESATLLRLRQQRQELLALAHGASLAPQRIQAQSAAEARLREAERDREAARQEAEAKARAEAVLAALRARERRDDSDEEGGGAKEQEGAGQSVIVKVRASDGSQERFKVNCAEPLEKLFKGYLKKVHPGGIPAGAVFSFRFDGDPIDDKQTPEDLGLEDDDMIEVVRTR